MQQIDTGRIKVIGFDADDTLWVNEPYYRATEEKFCSLMEPYAPAAEVNKRLYEVEMANMELYGYGTKAFVLSLIETAILVSGGRVNPHEIFRIIHLGKEQIALKNSLLPGVVEVLKVLSGHFRLIVATKGDLLDQERKLRNSGIAGFFHHIEIMTGKNPENYARLLSHLDIYPEEFIMVGNSLKSDVLPVVSLGGSAVHIPFHVTWQHEEVNEEEIPSGRFVTLNSISDILPLMGIHQDHSLKN